MERKVADRPATLRDVAALGGGGGGLPDGGLAPLPGVEPGAGTVPGGGGGELVPGAGA